MYKISCYATVGKWATTEGTDFKNIFKDVPDILDFGMNSTELFYMFKMLYRDRLIYYKMPIGDPLEQKYIASTLAVEIANYTKMYKYKYTKLVETENAVYNPIENYSMTETGTDTRTPNITNTDTNKYSNSSTAENTTETTTGVTTYDNTADFINQNKGNDTASGKTSAEGDSTTTRKETGTETTQHIFTRSGNIGVTTSQQMIQSERDVADFSAVRTFLDDIANVICLSIY